MCLPDDMTFQYFFFDTYPGYFLQALPAALLAGALFVLLRVRRNGRETLVKSLIPALFVCYLAGLVCLTLFLDVMGEVYYFLFCHMPGGRHIHWFSGSLDFDLVLSLGSEQIGDFLMFLPFGILYPLFRPGSTLPRTIAAGAAVCLCIELLQPVFGRSLDVTDIVLNGAVVVLSACVFHGVRAAGELLR